MQNLKTYKLHIAGEAVDPAGGEWFETVNPYTAKPWALIPSTGGCSTIDPLKKEDSATACCARPTGASPGSAPACLTGTVS